MLKFLASTPVLTLIAAILTIVFKYVRSRSCADPRLVKFAATLPGPPALPIVGNALDLFLARADTMDWLSQCEKKYGSIFRAWIGKQLIVYLSDVNDLEYVSRNPRVSAKPPLFDPFGEFFGDGLISCPTHVWKITRKLQQTAYTSKVLSSYVPDINGKIYSFVETLRKFVDGPECDVIGHLPDLTFDIIAKTTLGVDLDDYEKKNLDFHQCLQTVFDTCFRKMFHPWLRMKPVYNLVMEKARANVREKISHFADQRLKEYFDQFKKSNDENTISEQSSLTPFMLAAYRSQLATGKESIIRDELLTTLSGGTETVAITGAICLLAIATNPSIQDRLYDEIFELFGDSDRPAAGNDIARLPYLDQVMKETMRRYPPGTLLYKSVEKDAQIGAHTFPAGTEIVIPIFGVHMNPKYYPNPEKFDPENFAPVAVRRRPKLAFLSFGIGPRNCIGMNYAFLETKLTLIALLRAYTFRSALKFDELKITMGFSILSTDGYRMSISLRDRRPSHMRDPAAIQRKNE